MKISSDANELNGREDDGRHVRNPKLMLHDCVFEPYERDRNPMTARMSAYQAYGVYANEV